MSNTMGVSISTGALVLEPVTAPFSLTSVNPTGVVGLASLAAGSEAVWSTPPPRCRFLASLHFHGYDDLGSVYQLVGRQRLRDAGFSEAGLRLLPRDERLLTVRIDSVRYGRDVQKEQKACNDCVMAGANCSDGTSSCPADIQTCLADLGDFSILVKLGINTACINGVCGSSPVPVVFASDPNNLVGPSGVGGQRWITGGPTLTYGISFSNEPAAPVPAQQVIVTQPLGAHVSLNTLTVSGINLPNGTSYVQVPVPPGAFNPGVGADEFTTVADLRPTQSLLVNVDAKLDPGTQTLTWTLTSIDPGTGQPPVNPLVGLLPPGAGGSVFFSVTPAPGLATGTQVSDQAAVIFDGNAPLSTAVWTKHD